MKEQAAERQPRLDPGIQERIIRLDIQDVPRSTIAKEVGVNRRTVDRTIDRHYKHLGIGRDVDADRERAIAIYTEVKAAAWRQIERDEERQDVRPAQLLTVLKAQERIDRLLALTPTGPDDPVMVLSQLKQTVVNLILSEAPQLAPVLAQRLQALAERN